MTIANVLKQGSVVLTSNLRRSLVNLGVYLDVNSQYDDPYLIMMKCLKWSCTAFEKKTLAMKQHIRPCYV